MLSDSAVSAAGRNSHAYLLEPGKRAPAGYRLYLAKPGAETDSLDAASGSDGQARGANIVELPDELGYLQAGDVVSLSPDGSRIRTLWRRNSRQNSILLTERCDHYCLMCSQPPKRALDDWLLGEAFELVRLLPPDTTEIGFTGGEPTLHRERLLELLRLCRNLLPEAAVHVLSNGRRFADPAFAEGWAAVDNPRMMVGIPIYGAEPGLHDYVVQARGAFDETIRGILNLATLDQPVEIRVVIHKQTAPALPRIAEFIARNLPFVDQVALMGLEMIGFARANVESVWIDPVDYQPELVEAVRILERTGPKTMIYNHQLCLLDRRLWPYAVRSISDWKNEYHPECIRCSVAHECGGFFHSAKYRHSDHIKAIEPRLEVRKALQLLDLSAR